jgi:hypothetical protein
MKGPSRRDFVKHIAATAGTFGLLRRDAFAQIPAPDRSAEGSRAPTLNPRACGWLRFLWEKATTADDWSSSGVPHQWWDVYTNPNVNSYGRFDLHISAYGMLLMADQTPAWREVYTRVVDGLASRYPTYWGAIDWLTQIGDDPKRANYSERDFELMPPALRGKYNRIGWTANGITPWGLQPDPIGADGYLFFRGWFNLLLTIYKYVSGDDKWERPFSVTGYGDRKFQWDHRRIAERLQRQYARQDAGPHCENTKIWFSCNSAAALGLYLFDRLNRTRTHTAAESWLEYARRNYMHINAAGALESVTRYYDPIVKYKNNMGPEAAMNIAFTLLPQHREMATAVYDAAANAAGWRKAGTSPRASLQGFLVARELGDDAAVTRLSAAADKEYEPRVFGDQNEKFGWFFHLNEAYPRGQLSAYMMISQIGEPGAWSRAFQAQHLDKFAAPTVEGVDFPSLGINQAWNDADNGTLHVGTYAANPGRRGADTSWRVTKLPNASGISIRCDGEPFHRFQVTANDTIRIDSTIDTRHFEVVTGYRGGRAGTVRTNEHVDRVHAVNVAAPAPEAVRRASLELLSGRGPTCPCCS